MGMLAIFSSARICLPACYFCKHLDFERGLNGLGSAGRCLTLLGPVGKMQMDLGLF